MARFTYCSIGGSNKGLDKLSALYPLIPSARSKLLTPRLDLIKLRLRVIRDPAPSSILGTRFNVERPALCLVGSYRFTYLAA